MRAAKVFDFGVCSAHGKIKIIWENSIKLSLLLA